MYDQSVATRIVELLDAHAELESHTLNRALSVAKSENERLEVVLGRLGMVEESTLIIATSTAYGVERLSDDLSEVRLDVSTSGELTMEYCVRNLIAPILWEDETCLIVTADPGDQDLFSEISYLLDRPVRAVAGEKRAIRSILNTGDVNTSTTDEQLDRQSERDRGQFRDSGLDGPTIRFVSRVFEDAVHIGASDVHFETQVGGLRLRTRIKGVLHDVPVDSGLDPEAVTARLKVLAGMNVSERRLPQDGRIQLNVLGRLVDFRVASIPTAHGESVVCRVLDPKALRLGWEKLGFCDEIRDQILEVLAQPNGLFLVTGPTGSGKTTTLYTALSHLNRTERKVLSVEDPIEYELSGVEQVQVNEAVGLSFARALRAFLRLDPNVIMVGEIRDQETADIACRAALVGRLVLSTLHTNAPEEARTRLVDLGVEPFIVDSVLRGVFGAEVGAYRW